MHGVVEYDISPVRGPLANAFIILINALFFNIKLIGLHDIYPRDCSQKLLNEEESIFDFIIVGAGAAGCAVANRITEQEKWTVLLIEAGDYPSPTTEVPALYPTLVGSKEDWQFQMEKEPRACKGFINERCTISRGKVLGGTSTINDLLYVRGLTQDYDKNDFDKWVSNITYQIFNEIESYDVSESFSYNYGTSGPVHLNFINYTGTPRDLLIGAYRISGYKQMPRRHSIGFMEHLMMVKNGERFNMAKSFLTPIKDRPNLFFTKNTEVETVGITEPVDKRANGVNVTIDGIRLFLRARKEVILTAGAINNAKILLVSGLGPRKYLTSRKLPFFNDLPNVGQNLQLHFTVPVYVSIEPCFSICQREFYRESDLIKDAFEYVMYRTGNLSHTNINGFVNYILTKKTGTTLPNIAIHHMYFKIGDRNLMAWIDGMNYHPKIINSLINVNKEKAIILFLVTLINPMSRGEVLLNETHYLGNPSVRGNFLSDDENWDYETLLTGFNYVTNLTELMTDNHATFLNLDIPNCRNFKFCNRAYVKCYIQNMAYPKSDAVGTMKMGPACDDSAVVKDDLEVRKVRCLRVGDSSVLNYMPLGSTVATDAMIGYGLAELLKEKWIENYVSPFQAVEPQSK